MTSSVEKSQKIETKRKRKSTTVKTGRASPRKLFQNRWENDSTDSAESHSGAPRKLQKPLPPTKVPWPKIERGLDGYKWDEPESLEVTLPKWLLRENIHCIFISLFHDELISSTGVTVYLGSRLFSRILSK